MVYFDSWDEFATAVEQLCIAEPNKVRKSYVLQTALSQFVYEFSARVEGFGNIADVLQQYFSPFVVVSFCCKVSPL